MRSRLAVLAFLLRLLVPAGAYIDPLGGASASSPQGDGVGAYIDPNGATSASISQGVGVGAYIDPPGRM